VDSDEDAGVPSGRTAAIPAGIGVWSTGRCVDALGLPCIGSGGGAGALARTRPVPGVTAFSTGRTAGRTTGSLGVPTGSGSVVRVPVRRVSAAE